MRILLAEDERLTRRSLQRQLESWGHDVAAAEDGARAWDLYTQEPFDVVISDWEMPNVDGLELMRRVRDHDRPGYVYLIMLTARADKDDLVKGMDTGADDFVTKPFEKNELRVRLRAGERVIQLERALAGQNRSLESANKRMKSDLDAAARVQQSILPDQMADLPFVTSAWRYQPCDELAGDALNVLALDERLLCAYVLDVSGHGVPAALLSVAIARGLQLTDDPSSLINSSRGDCGFGRFGTPADVAMRLNERFPFEANGNRFFTMIYSLLDLETGRLTFCCAGHPGPIRVTRNGETEAMESPALMIGVEPDPHYENTSVELCPGDRVYFYSDGIIEQGAADAGLFGKDRLCRTLAAARGRTLQESIDSVVADLSKWADRNSFDDDLSLVGIEWRGPDDRAAHG